MKEYAWKAVLCQRSFALIGFIFVCCFGRSAEKNSWSQEPIWPIPSAQKVAVPLVDVFAVDLEVLSLRLGVTFIAEGQPFPPNNKLPAPSLSNNLSSEAAVREVADYFDYSAVRQGNIYLLMKRYTNPEDMPEVTPEECMNGLKAISKILILFNPKIPTGTFAGEPMANIVHLLSTEQLERLSKSGLSVSELTPSQHEEVWRLALDFYLQSEADHVEETYSILENRNPADPVFHWQTIMNVHAFGYDTRSAKLNKILFIPVSDSNRIIVNPDGGTGKFSSVHTHNGVVVPDLDPADPNGVPEPTKRFLDDKGRHSNAISISQAMSGLNGRTANHVVYKVDAEYAAKRVILVGVDKLPGDVLMRALAAVYGLRIARNEDGNLVLTHPLVIKAKQLPDLGRALQSAIPAPIYRAIRTQALAAHKEIKGMKRPVLANEYQAPGFAIHRSAIQMFLYVAEAEVKAHTGEKLALSHLGERANTMFMIAETVDSFSQVCWLTDRPLPPYVADIDHVTLTGGIYRNAEDAELFSLHFSYINPKTGIMYSGIGFTNAIVP